jgi:flagellar biogenesis protein FliO
MLLPYLKDLLHCLLGLIIVGFLIWLLIKIHIYFSKNNNSIENILETSRLDGYIGEHNDNKLS